MIKAIITDIEGTITDIHFVHKVLFPYSLQKMHDFVHHNYRSIEETIAQIKLKYLSLDSSLDQVIAQLKHWIETDQKISELKTLQGQIWKQGYESGAFTGHIYIDAYQKLKEWYDAGIELYVYSSGSVQAQKLLFKYSDFGDLTPLFINYFDTQVGAKKEMQSYQNATMLGKRNLEKQAKESLSPNKSGKKVEDLENDFRQVRENKQKEINQWLSVNTNNVNDFLNKVLQKGKYNGRTVDTKWAEKIKSVMSKSSDVFLADFVRYTEPDKNGVSHLYAPDVVDYLDFALNREQFKKSSKRRVDNANASTLEEKAKVAHQTAIDTEKVAEKSKESDIKWFMAYESQKGKRHPKDPRGAKS